MGRVYRWLKFNTFWILPALAAVIFFSAGWFWRGRLLTGTHVTVDPVLRESPKSYEYVNPLLACGSWESKDFDEYTAVKSQVTDYIARMVKIGNAEQVGVYFRELKSSHWFGVNENAKFSPASLIKIPIMIAYLKLAEKEPSILKKTFVYSGADDLNRNETFRSSFALVPGGVYTVDSLLKAMIVNSDNNAADILANNINSNSLAEVFTDLVLPVPDMNNATAEYMSPKSYSYFFRILYNATYLNEDLSEKALGLLAGPDFPQGLASVAEPGIIVAQKFGERSVFDPDGTVLSRELHDCGIVYYPSKPYLLCVMTKGNDFRNLLTIIQTIGRTVYADVKNSN